MDCRGAPIPASHVVSRDAHNLKVFSHRLNPHQVDGILLRELARLLKCIIMAASSGTGKQATLATDVVAALLQVPTYLPTYATYLP